MTPRLKQCLDIIKQSWDEYGYAPSFEEIRKGLGAKSKSSVASLVAKLEARGYVERTPNLARSLRVIPQGQPPVPVGPGVPSAVEQPVKRQRRTLSPFG